MQITLIHLLLCYSEIYRAVYHDFHRSMYIFNKNKDNSVLQHNYGHILRDRSSPNCYDFVCMELWGTTFARAPGSLLPRGVNWALINWSLVWQRIEKLEHDNFKMITIFAHRRNLKIFIHTFCYDHEQWNGVAMLLVIDSLIATNCSLTRGAILFCTRFSS